MVCTPWLPPGGSCQTALRNRLTDEGRRQLNVLDFPVEWCNLEHMPLIQLHSSTNRSLPLISLFWQSVPKCRLPKNPASPRGKPRGRNHAPTATNGVHSLSFAFAQQLPQRGSQGHFVPAGGSGNQRIGTSSVRHCPAALPPASTASKCFADYQLLCELLILRLEIRIFYGYNSVCVFCNR